MAKTLDKILNAQTTTLGIKLVDRGSLQCVLVPRKQISVYHFGQAIPRILAKYMAKRINVEKIKRRLELLPGGDIRLQDNQWIRLAFRDSGLRRVPRETQIRAAVCKLTRKKKLGSKLSVVLWIVLWHCNFWLFH